MFSIWRLFTSGRASRRPNRVPEEHGIDPLTPVVEELRRLDADPFTTRDDVVRTLGRFGRIAAQRGRQ